MEFSGKSHLSLGLPPIPDQALRHFPTLSVEVVKGTAPDGSKPFLGFPIFALLRSEGRTSYSAEWKNMNIALKIIVLSCHNPMIWLSLQSRLRAVY
jgi:hypothetical protein